MKAHRTKKEQQEMALFERCVTEGNEKTDELAKDGAMLDGGVMGRIRAITVQQKKRGGLRCIAVLSQLSHPGV